MENEQRSLGHGAGSEAAGEMAPRRESQQPAATASLLDDAGGQHRRVEPVDVRRDAHTEVSQVGKPAVGLADKVYPLAPNGIFWSVQGEGALLGTPMVFVRLAGCSIGCSGCDTDYRVAGRIPASAIGQAVRHYGEKWTWVTGGEPADHDLGPLLEALRLCGKVALITSGHKPLRAASRLVDFLAISPHGKPADLQLRHADQLNLVPGLNGLNLDHWRYFDTRQYGTCWVTPLFGNEESLRQALDFVKTVPGWRLGIQAHKHWLLP